MPQLSSCCCCSLPSTPSFHTLAVPSPLPPLAPLAHHVFQSLLLSLPYLPLGLLWLRSSADASFWHGLCDRKLKEYKLSEDPRPLTGFFGTGTRAGLPARLCVGGDSFAMEAAVPQLSFPMGGTLHCTNTIDAFKTCVVPRL